MPDERPSSSTGIWLLIRLTGLSENSDSMPLLSQSAAEWTSGEWVQLLPPPPP